MQRLSKHSAAASAFAVVFRPLLQGGMKVEQLLPPAMRPLLSHVGVLGISPFFLTLTVSLGFAKT